MLRLFDRPLTVNDPGVDLPRRIRTVIIDDHPVLHEALTDMFMATPDIQVCGGAYCAREAAALVEAVHPETAIVDISLGEEYGIDVIQALHARFPELKIVAFSMYDELLYAERALRAGASGYVMKSEPTGTLLSAIRGVVRSGAYFSPRIAARVQPSTRNAVYARPFAAAVPEESPALVLS